MAFDAEAPLTPRDRMVRVRNFLQTLPPEQFDQMFWDYQSQTSPTCIGGWAARLFVDELPPIYQLGDAGALLGLGIPESLNMFCGHAYFMATRGNPTPPDAVKLIDHYLDTGEVSWNWLMREPRRDDIHLHMEELVASDFSRAAQPVILDEGHFVRSSGYLVDADFSSVETRVTAWLVDPSAPPVCAEEVIEAAVRGLYNASLSRVWIDGVEQVVEEAA